VTGELDPKSFGGVVLRFDRDWCGDHLEPFRHEWPKGSAVAMLLLFRAFCADDRVQRMAGAKPDLGIAADAKVLPTLVAECSPLCCFLPEPVTREVIRTALEGHGPMLEDFKREQAP
jgi:hypothetical protein